jgi:cytochrome c biogenesis protein CcdA
MIAPLAGLVAGIAHAVSGPDHLAAVAPLSLSGGKRSWRVGVQWGLGHALSVAVVGSVALVTREVLPWDLISTVSERLVGLLLIGLGIWGIRGAFKSRLHSHPHQHESVLHEHVHAHPDLADPTRARSHAHGHSAFGIGALHGLAGGRHVLAAVAALAFSSTGEAIFYLAAYAVGTVTAMALFSAALTHLVLGTPDTRQRWLPLALGASSVAALICGGYWVVA